MNNTNIFSTLQTCPQSPHLSKNLSENINLSQKLYLFNNSTFYNKNWFRYNKYIKISKRFYTQNFQKTN